MKIIVSGGTGFVGRNLIPALLHDGHKVAVVGRHNQKIEQIFPQVVSHLTWEQLDNYSPDDFDAIINLAGENIAQTRWTKVIKHRIKDSRMHATKKLINWGLKAQHKKPHLYNASAIGVYGLQPVASTLPKLLTEESKILFRVSGRNFDRIEFLLGHRAPESVAGGHYPVQALNSQVRFPIREVEFG